MSRQDQRAVSRFAAPRDSMAAVMRSRWLQVISASDETRQQCDDLLSQDVQIVQTENGTDMVLVLRDAQHVHDRAAVRQRADACAVTMHRAMVCSIRAAWTFANHSAKQRAQQAAAEKLLLAVAILPARDVAAMREQITALSIEHGAKSRRSCRQRPLTVCHASNAPNVKPDRFAATCSTSNRGHTTLSP